jgi:broad specificity phosphatase PhoE
MKITLVRHGETVENANRIVQGQSEGMLNQRGVQQAKDLAKKLKGEHFDAVYCSDLQRCVDTVSEIIKYHPDLKVGYSQSLREVNFGLLQGKKASEIDWSFAFNNDGNVVYGGGESYMMMAHRVIDFINSLLQEYKGKKVLIVTHGGPIRAIKASMQDEPLGEVYKNQIPNATPLIYELMGELKTPNFR